MEQGCQSWSQGVDPKDLCCLHDLMMMMMSVRGIKSVVKIKCDDDDKLIGGEKVGDGMQDGDASTSI